MPSQAANLTALRKSGHKLRGYGSFFVGAEVLEATVDSTPADGALNLTITVVDGDTGDVQPGYRVDVYSSDGNYKGRTRVRYAGTISTTNLPIREHSKGIAKIEAGDTVRVYAEVRLSDKLVAADETFAPEHEVYSAQNSNPGPIANSGGPWAGDESLLPIQMTGDTSDVLDPDSTPGNVSHKWVLPDGLSFEAGSTETDANPELTGVPGSYLVKHVVTDDDNGVSTTSFVPIIIHGTGNEAYDVEILSLEGDEQSGWSATVRFFDPIPVTTVPDGSLFIFWIKEDIDGTTQSFGAASPGRSHIKLVGYLRRDISSGDYQNDELVFEIISPIARLNELVGYSKVMTNTASPDAWSEVKTLSVEQAVYLLLMHYTNLNNAGFDIITAANFRDALYSQLFLTKSTPYDQVMQLADSRDGRLICDRTGRFELQGRLELEALGNRSSRTTTITLNNDDLIDYDLTREHWEAVEFLRTRGFTAGATANNPVFAKAPGSAPGEGNEDTTEDKLIVDHPTDNYNRCGRRWARKARVYQDSSGTRRHAPRLQITLYGSYDVLDFYTEWVEFEAGTTDNMRGVELSDFRWILRRVSVEYTGGTARTTLTLDAETHGEPGVDDTPPPDTTTGFDPGTWTPPDLYFPPFDGTFQPVPFIPGGLVAGTKRLALIASNGHIYRTTNFDRPSALGGPSYDDVDLSGTIGSSVLQWCYDARSNTASTNGWVVTTTAIYYISNIWGVPTATLQHTFSSSSSYRNIDFDYILSPGLFGIVASRYSPGGVRVVYTTNGGSTWSSEVTVDTGVSIGAFVPALQISARTYGKAWTFAYSGGLTRVETMRVTTTNGASWSALTNVYDDDGLGGGLVIPYADITETIAYHGYWNTGGTTPDPSYNRTNNVFRSTIDTGRVDITPIVSTVRYGPDQKRGRFTLSASPSSVSRLLVCGVNEAETSRGVFLITNADSAHDAASTAFTTLVTPGASVPYTRGVLVDDTTAYIFGLNGAIAYSADGATVDDRRGNLITTAEIVGVTG